MYTCCSELIYTLGKDILHWVGNILINQEKLKATCALLLRCHMLKGCYFRKVEQALQRAQTM